MVLENITYMVLSWWTSYIIYGDIVNIRLRFQYWILKLETWESMDLLDPLNLLSVCGEETYRWIDWDSQGFPPLVFAALCADLLRVQAPPVAGESAFSSRHADKVRLRTRTAPWPLLETRCCVALPSVFALAAHHLPTPRRAAPHTHVSACLSSALLLTGALKTLERLRRRRRRRFPLPQVFTDASVLSAPHQGVIRCRFLAAIISQ